MKNFSILGIDDLKELAQCATAPCVTIYAPLRNGIFKTKEGPVRLGNQLKIARKYLEKDFSMSREEIEKLLKPAAALGDDHFFWKTPADGLAVFVAPGLFRRYRLPIRFAEETTVARRFDMKPLFPLLMGNQRYYLLLLSKRHARLFQGSKYAINEVKDTDFGEGADFYPAKSGDKRLESHGVSTAEKSSIFHGHGGLKDAEYLITEKFFRSVNEKLRQLLMFENAPLVLSAPEKLTAMYKDINDYPNLIDAQSELSAPSKNEKDFASDAWKTVRNYFEKRIDESLERYDQMAGSQKVSSDSAEIITAAANGRVECLFCAKNAQLWGKIDPILHRPVFSAAKSEGDEDLAGRAVLETFSQRGLIWILSEKAIPGQKMLAAIFRY